jgi:hypothetical protein
LFGVQKTWYTRDAQRNVLAVYNKPVNFLSFAASEFIMNLMRGSESLNWADLQTEEVWVGCRKS